MQKYIKERPEVLGIYIIENKATVRSAAAVFGISKSTVHKDVTKNLKSINNELYVKVKEVIEENKSQRHIRGGLATKRKYEELRKKTNEEKKVFDKCG